ncbi:MAG TPA: hypothetical protein VGP72_05580 [Planctomycetota bacterium]|jgi:hypothetical protein
MHPFDDDRYYEPPIPPALQPAITSIIADSIRRLDDALAGERGRGAHWYPEALVEQFKMRIMRLCEDRDARLRAKRAAAKASKGQYAVGRTPSTSALERLRQLHAWKTPPLGK